VKWQAGELVFWSEIIKRKHVVLFEIFSGCRKSELSRAERSSSTTSDWFSYGLAEGGTTGESRWKEVQHRVKSRVHQREGSCK